VGRRQVLVGGDVGDEVDHLVLPVQDAARPAAPPPGVGQVERITLRARDVLEAAHRLVGEVADGAAGERHVEIGG
jgi:hypothetical protein